jgi:hypothetical protein
VPFGVTVVALVVLLILTTGTGGTTTVELHGGGVLPGWHKLPGGGVKVAVFAIVAGGATLTVPINV